MVCKVKYGEECPSNNACTSFVPISMDDGVKLHEDGRTVNFDFDSEQAYVPACVAGLYGLL